MKRIMTLWAMVLLAVGSASAQKGMQGVGVNLGMNAGDGVGVGAGIKYQYNLSNYIRIEPSFTFYSSNGYDYFTSTGLVNFDFMFVSPRALRPYFFVGLGYTEYADRWEYYDYHELGIDAGFGLDWRMNHHFSLQLEAGAIGTGEGSAAIVNLGVTYNF